MAQRVRRCASRETEAGKHRDEQWWSCGCPDRMPMKRMKPFCSWVIPKSSWVFSVLIFYLDKKCADFHPVSGQIELWHIVHNLLNWFHILLLAVSWFWRSQILLPQRCCGASMITRLCPWCQLWVLTFPSLTAGTWTKTQTGMLLAQGHFLRGVNDRARIWTQVNLRKYFH